MRKSKKHSSKPTPQDKEFERLYRTIPSAGLGSNPAPEQPIDAAPQKPRWKKVLKRIALTLLTLVLLAGIWVGWKVLYNEIKIFGWQGLVDSLRTTRLKGEDEGRVNILLAGNSADDPGHGGAQLTDSIMIASIDTKDKTGFIMSIPRDLYVNIPGFGYAKINEAYQDGKNANFSESGYATGGMGLLEKTVSQKFGLTLDYYALVDYSALEQSVNAVGGVDINIQSTDPRGLYDPSRDLKTGQPLVRLPNGTVHLDGHAALDLSRARGDSYGSYGYGMGDFVRTENQRKILLGIKDKATSISTLSNPVKLGELLDSMGSNVQTDLKTSEVKRLYQLSKEVPSAKVQSESLNNAEGKNLLRNSTYHYQSVLVPAAGLDDYSQIQDFVSKLTVVGTSNSNGSSNSSASSNSGQ